MNIELHNVTHSVGGHIVLDDLSLHIASGQRCVIAGPNGSGKTTLLRLLAGLALPNNGRITLADRVVAAEGKNIVPPARRNISLVFQDLGLWPHLSVKKHLQIAARESSLHGDAAINHMLQACKLVSLSGRCPSTLSGGEQQRLALSRHIQWQPPLHPGLAWSRKLADARKLLLRGAGRSCPGLGAKTCVLKVELTSVDASRLPLRARESLFEIVRDPGLGHHQANSMRTQISAFHFFHRRIVV